MTIWVVQNNSVYEREDLHSTTAFLRYEDAKKEFDKQVEEEKTYDHLVSEDDAVIEETDTSFLIYRDGEYCEDHCEVTLKEIPVQE